MASNPKKTSMLVRKPKSFHILEREALALFGEREKRPQEEDPRLYQFVRKLNYGLLDSQIGCLTEDLKDAVSGFRPSREQLEVQEDSLHLYPAGCVLQIIDSTEEFDDMITDLTKQFEIGVDLEFHMRYSLRGTTSLLQVSTISTDYIVCPFLSRDDIIQKLAPIMLNPAISKVFHAIDNDFLALRRDFNITVVGAVDTKEAYKILESTSNAIGFENLMKYLNLHCEVDRMPDKEVAQKADFRVRPLPAPLVAYARHDSHAVLRAWNHLKIKLEEKGISSEKVFYATAALVGDLKYKPPKQEDPVKGLKSVVFPKTLDLHAAELKFIDLRRWRLQVGLMVDCSPQLILTNKQIVEIISSSPKNHTEMQLLLNQRFPPFLRGHQGVAFFKVYDEGMRSPEYNPKCHNCFLNSHQAWACWKSKDRSAWKRYMNDPANLAIKQRQYQRRQRKLQENQEKRRLQQLRQQ